MGLLAGLKRELTFIGRLRRLLKRIKPIDLDSDVLVCDDIEQAVDAWPDACAIEDELRAVTYREFDALSNRYAHWARGRGVKRGDTVALMMMNRIEYLAAWVGVSKIGAATALINTNLTGQPLAHCLDIAGARLVVADSDCWPAIEDARLLLEKPVSLWVHGLKPEDETSERRGLDAAVKGASAVRPDRAIRKGLTNRDTALYIYTSGTTGLPKAARIPHSRARTYMRAFAGFTAGKSPDRLYCVLPLYHATGGLCGVGSALLNGGTVILRKRFSANGFWPDVAASRATTFVYIGELCRYLLNTPESEFDRAHGLRLAFGNGLRGEVWTPFQSRFAIPEIIEFYGSTEGNVSLFNFDGKAGAVGRIPPYLRSVLNVRLIRYDVDADDIVRGSDGLVQEAGVGEVGEAVGEIKSTVRNDYSGYADRKASEKKVLRDVFRKGDAWFRTGDLMRRDSKGYFYFIDRIGDTYRWKGENVSTTEVEQRLAEAPNVGEVIAYGVGVPGYDGKAGMVVISIDGRFSIKRFAEYVNAELPHYARPVFVRLKKILETTGTFKYRKVDLVSDGFDPHATDDALYVRKPDGSYARINDAVHADVISGALRL